MDLQFKYEADFPSLQESASHSQQHGGFVGDQIETSQRSDLFDPTANDRNHWRNRSPRITRSMVRGVESTEVPVGEWKREIDVETGEEYDVFRSNADGSELERRAADFVSDED